MTAILTLVLVMAMALVACGTTTTTGVGGSNGVVLHTKTVTINGAQKTVLADTSGKTLYYFMPDTATTIACSGSCATTWPPVASSGTPTSSDSLSGKLSVVNGANGSQATYNGHPLYTYSKDQSASDALGEGLFGKWFVVTPDLAPLPGAPAGQPTDTPSSGY
jgi:predicted lipoprotein with Yx(FWY)xxD motif